MKLLHISDLHLRDEYDISNRLTALINVLHNYHFEVCVITGDFRNFDCGWGKPIEFVNTLLSETVIDNLIVVPGNHDLTDCKELSCNRRTGDCSILSGDIDNEIVRQQYDKFECDFIKKIDNKNTRIIHPGLTHRVVPIEGINFVAINSVYAFNSEETSDVRINPFCFNCKKLNELLDELRIESKNSVAVTHIPFDDVDSCFGNYDYDDGHTTRKKLEEKFFCCFAGHEHTKKNDYYKVVGARCFMDNNYNCAIYDISLDNNQIHSIRKTNVSYYGMNGQSSFTLGLDEKEILEILSISKEHLKPQIFGRNIKYSTDDVIVNSKADHNALIINHNQYEEDDLSTVFNAICELKQIDKGGKVVNTNNFDNKTNIFKELIDILRDRKFDLNTQQNRKELLIPITIKGEIGTGKSTFLNILFWEMLLRQKSNFEYVPILIDFVHTNKSQLQKIVNKIREIEKTYKKSIYILVDGLDNCQIYNENAPNLWGVIEELMGVDCKFILCINQHRKSFLEGKKHRNDFQFIKDNKISNYILYLRPLSYVEKYFHFNKCEKGVFCNGKNKLKELDDFFDRFIRAYFSLSKCRDYSKIEQAYNIIKNNEAVLVDFNFLHSIRLTTLSTSTNDFDKLKTLFFRKTNTKAIEKAAEKYLMTNEFIPYDEFKLLKSTNIINFAFAMHIIAHLQDIEYISNSITFPQVGTKRIPEKYFNTTLNGYIKVCLAALNDKNVIAKNIVNSINKAISDHKPLNYKTIAQLIYILRQTDIDSDELKQLTKAIRDSEKLNKNDRNKKKKKDSANYLIALRTIEVTEIYQGVLSLYKHLQALMSNSKRLKFNRQFSLFYYGDRYALGSDENTEYEYYNTFCKLYYRIQRKANNFSDEDPGIILDLFTICNIVQIMAQRILNKENFNSKRAFYLHSTIAMLYELLVLYLKQNEKDISYESEIVYYYFYSLKNDFGYLLYKFYQEYCKKVNKVEDFVKKHIGDDEFKLIQGLVCIPFSDDKTALDVLFRLDKETELLRGGWKDRVSLKTSRHESVAEHTFSVMLYSLFLSNEHNEKLRDDLHKLAFFHDLAEVYYGDAIPSNSKYNNIQDKVRATLLSFCYLCTYESYMCWLNYAHIIINYVFTREGDLKNRDYRKVASIMNLIDKLQRSVKLAKYGYEYIYIEQGRLEEFYSECKSLDISVDNNLRLLKEYAINKLDGLIKKE